MPGTSPRSPRSSLPPRAIAVLDLSHLEASMEGRRVLVGLSRYRKYPWRCIVGGVLISSSEAC